MGNVQRLNCQFYLKRNFSIYRHSILTQNISYDSPDLGESNKKKFVQFRLPVVSQLAFKLF